MHEASQRERAGVLDIGPEHAGRPLKILVTAYDYRPGLGGIATCGYELARALAAEPGVQVRLLAPRCEGDEAFDRHGLVWAPVQSIEEVAQDPQARALGAFASVKHPTGDIEVIRSPVEFGATPASIRRSGPELGEHTEEVLLEHGYSWEDIAALKEQGAIG